MTRTGEGIAVWLVGIGASAGGVEALRELLPALPGGPVAYVVAQHMSPAHPSLLMQVLSRETELPVREIEDGMPMEPGIIYVVPPNRDVQVRAGTLQIMQAAPRISPQPSIDVLLQSIAAEAGETAMGVILSGTGSDGVAGMQLVHEMGGRTIAQEPSSARYRDMPTAAIDAGVVELVLSPAGIGNAIAAILAGSPVAAPGGRFGSDPVMAALAAATRRVTGWDIASYKDGTLGRQLAKRVAALGLTSTAEYLAYVEENVAELEVLRDSMLITVTGFLRDRKSFDALAEALRPVVSAKSPGEPLRAWVAGCATGEEAYSVAMLLSEAAREQGLDLPVQVFATDISDAAMETARRGLYPATAIADLPPSWQDRYFRVVDDLAQVDKRLRDMLVIARQDITRDPPLVRMDLVSCRNLLIYLVPSVQQRVLTNLHAALGHRGLLFLGRSESIPADTDLFTTVDAASRVFQRRPGSSLPVYTGLPMTPAPVRSRPRAAVPRPDRDVVRDHVRDRLLTQFAPPSILVDVDGVPLHMIGDVSRYLRLPGPDADLTIGSMITPALRTEVVSLLTRLERDSVTALGHVVVVPHVDGPGETLRLQVTRLTVPGAADPYALVSFVPESDDADAGPPSALGEVLAEAASDEASVALARRVLQLQHELDGTREHLQAVVEELESSNEELQAMNEELQASSEELQATNEELETTNEELQATNEELTTVNETLEVRTSELSEANVVLNNIQSSVHTAIVLVDREQRLQRFSPLAVKVFGLVAADIGTRLARLPSNLDLDNLPALLDKVMVTGEGEVLEVTSSSSTYLLQVMPYRDGDGVAGAVLALSDITELAEARAELTVRAEEFQMIAEAVPHMVYRASLDGAVVGYVSPTVSAIFGVDAVDVLADPNLLRTLVHPDDRTVVDRAERRGIDDDYDVDYRVVRPDGDVRSVREMSRVVRDHRDLPRYRVGTVIDITDLANARDAAEVHRSRAEGIFTYGGTPMMTLTREGLITSGNDFLAALLDVPADGLVGSAVTDYLHPDDAERTSRALDDLDRAPSRSPLRYRTRYVRPDGSIRHVDQTLASVAVPSTHGADRDSFVVASLRDVTDAEESRREAAAHLAQLQSIFDGSSAPMSITGLDGHIIRPNQALCDLLGYTAEELTGLHFAEYTYADDLSEESKLFGELLRGDRDRYSLVKRCLTSSGDMIWGRLTVRMAPSAEPDGGMVLMTTMLDVTKERDREAAALRIAQADPLTGLLNRTLVFDRLRQAIHRAHRTGEHISVLFIDLDGFKAVNDRLGHEAGDTVLITVAERLRSITRESDSIARLGGDEFVIIAPHDLQEPPHEGNRMAHDLLTAVAAPIDLVAAPSRGSRARSSGGGVPGGGAGVPTQLSLTASIGVAHYPSDGEDVETLVHRADLAMYSAKQRGGNQAAFYSSQLQDRARLRAAQRAELALGLESGHFVPFYQPVVDARTRVPVDLEILARWHHHERGLLPPADFLRLAEDFEQLDNLTDALVAKVVADLTVLRAAAPGVSISLNLAPHQLLRPDVVDRLTGLIGPDLSGWTLEVTEAAAFGGDGVVVRALERFRRLGAHTALDDFGSGYSSVGHLRAFGFDEVKIDQMFATDVRSVDDGSLVQAMVGMARALGAITVAEGVEHPSQADALTALGVDRLQGFLFAPPMPLDEAVRWLASAREGAIGGDL